MNNLVNDLKNLIGDNLVLDHHQASERSNGIWSGNTPLNVKALIRPKTTDQISKVMAYCNDHGQTVVVHGGLSNLTHATASTNEDVILSLENLNKIIEIDSKSRIATVESGVILQYLQEKAKEEGLLFPLDLGARGSCMIGGNIATNAGGIQVFRYGTMRQLILGLEVVLPDGRIISSLNKMIKDNAGYDLKQLFIGSEGTLGIITKATLRLFHKPLTTNTAIVAVDHFDKVVEFLNFAESKLSGKLSSFEVIWKNYYEFMTGPSTPYNPPVPIGYQYYILIETNGMDESADSDAFQEMLEDSFESDLIIDAAIADASSDHQWFWNIRENVEFVLKLGNPLFVFDVSLPIPNMAEYINEIESTLNNQYPDNQFFVFGHLGDGNLHIIIKITESEESLRRKIEELVYTPLIPINGSITAEHGIGLEKKQWLHISRSENEIDLMKQLKNTLDPKGILNPNKIF